MLRRILVAALLAACGAAHAALPEPVARLLQAANIPEEAMGAVVMRGDAVLLSHNAELPMQPASTMKLVTTMVGLDQLGPVFKGRTELRATGDVVNGALQGDLYLRGGADPDFDEDALVHMLEKLRTQGIRKITGDLVLDRQLFQPARTDVGAPPFDESPESYYNVIPDALLLNMNMLRVDISSTATQVKLDMLPVLERVTVASDMQLVDGDCAKWEGGWKLPTYERRGARITVTLHGTFPRNCAKTTAVNVLDRNDYAEGLFRSSWARLGGTFTGKAREALPGGATPATSRLLSEHVSRPLMDVLRDINKPSDNGLARTLFLSLGSLEADAVLGSRPLAPIYTAPPQGAAGPGVGDPQAGALAAATVLPTAIRAEQVIRAWMQRQGIDDNGLVLENGSGLSRLERVKPAQMAGLLRAAQKSLWMPEFLTSLPIAAVDGTMRRRLKDSAAAARARVKTGALRNVVSIAGYVPDANGDLCIVVAMVNHELVGNGNGRKAVDALIDWVAQARRLQ
ncbi:D-alanyl-D-alanine carboxypeptidase/D-alanyl-D-alanine endopeptidase [Pseudoduganella namucuonensis]|uniref:D-alanyl-D-alanine carboxypeptidase / D-alanyl-D-alanine-endopeptidase (Penicillin-binding protein 4) n=1 Tax=Pseudoduganella namucuonensis TaxID=1035707 RepID=A0A1I7L1Z3_9BURK|nr:D-alanyl-D-alanine carboxypeptidase/D-alanyl-D-alanine-endopeptidase [Pseudoduganella namucuonensis]SFV03534.1 D-alanyl-D-alanine carboxypeptidase / D-alanyl-D-alanine-endopeptidase (penicillin-binding protein 4) [Pseudoduganella namucuonensis]